MTAIHPTIGASPAEPVEVRRVRPEERALAIRVLLGGAAGQARRFLDYAREHSLPLEWLWAAFSPEGMEAVAMLSLNPGRTAMVLFSTPRDEETARLAAAALRGTLRDAASLELALVQALVDPRLELESAALEQAGFQHLAELSYLERAVPRIRPPQPPAPPGVRMDPWDPSERQLLLELLQATYEDTLDCPGLTGLRSGEDVLDGHMRGGRFDPSLWTILRIDGRPAGVLLLNATPQAGCVELSYLGLARGARGRGLGRLLLERAFRLAAGREEPRMVLAVDDQNAPALRLYEAAGFRRTLRRRAYIHPLQRPE